FDYTFADGGLYATGVNFSCFTGSKIIPFSYVNDDYCDCPDGSDEPGTSACPNAKFHCLNRGYKAVDIPSGRVNDQICDCCDGSDEWDSAVECPNICEEMGSKWREEIQRRAAVAQKGYAKRLELAQEGAKIKAEKEKGIDALRKERDELSPKKDEAEAKKKEAEEKETEAKDRHRKAWEVHLKGYAKRLELAQEGAKIKAEKEKGIDALRKERDELSPKKEEAEAKKKEAEEKETEAKDRHRKAWEEERDRKKQIKIVALFGMLDANSDQKITLDEVKAFKEFDSDNNGEVSDDEAKEIPHAYGSALSTQPLM
uniref:EF-hand domain-containing protein n=1 Tax=Ascaris lumbricoides TaxID=6252 RepID=A0A0M3IUH9_ASCLU